MFIWVLDYIFFFFYFILLVEPFVSVWVSLAVKVMVLLYQDQDSLLVKRRNDGHSPGPVIRELVPSSHQKVNLATQSSASSADEIRESGRAFQSLIVHKVVNDISASKGI